MHAARIVCGGLVPLASLLSLASVSPSAARQTQQKQQKKSSEEEIKVLANMPLQDTKVNQMFVKEWNNKTYLYLHQPKEDTYMLVDVTNPANPTVVSRDAIKGSAPEGPVADSPLAITTTKEETKEEGSAKAVAELPTQTINFVDLTNPKDLKTVKTFKGVTSIYSDDANKLVYLVNGEGLWIVRHRNTSALPVCPPSGLGPYCPPPMN
jgi:hypothetical protein